MRLQGLTSRRAASRCTLGGSKISQTAKIRLHIFSEAAFPLFLLLKHSYVHLRLCQVLSKHDPPTLELPAGARVRRGALLRIAIRNAPGWEHDWLGLFGRGVPCGSACEPLSGRIVLHGECFADLDIPTNAADRSGPLPVRK